MGSSGRGRGEVVVAVASTRVDILAKTNTGRWPPAAKLNLESSLTAMASACLI